MHPAPFQSGPTPPVSSANHASRMPGPSSATTHAPSSSGGPSGNGRRSNPAADDGEPSRTSLFHGVTWYKASKRWQARLCTGRKQYHLGYFMSEQEAARAYDRAILSSPTPIHAQLNFPDEAEATRQGLAASAAAAAAAQHHQNPLPHQVRHQNGTGGGHLHYVPGGSGVSENLLRSGGGSAALGQLPMRRALPVPELGQDRNVRPRTASSPMGLSAGNHMGPVKAGLTTPLTSPTPLVTAVGPGQAGTLPVVAIESGQQARQALAIARAASAPVAVAHAAGVAVGQVLEAGASVDAPLMQGLAGQPAVPGVLLPDKGLFIPSAEPDGRGLLTLYEFVWDGSHLQLASALALGLPQQQPQQQQQPMR